MSGSYCVYPPQLADDVEITEQRDGDRLAFIAGSASVGRYINRKMQGGKIWTDDFSNLW